MYKDHERQKEYMKNWIHKARVEGRVSKGGIKYEFSQFVQFKNNPKYAQRLARELYHSEENPKRCAQLEAIGVKLVAGRQGIRPALGLKHTCNDKCSFFGHFQTWVAIEPVAYKIHFHGDFDFEGEDKTSYWIFKRYSVTKRKPDFPEVKPVFRCEKCDFRIEFQHIDDMFTFEHNCRLHYALTIYTSDGAFNIGNIYNDYNGQHTNGLTEQQFYEWLSRYKGLFFAGNYRIEVRSAWA